jgi:hypothetical protein
MAIVEPYRMHHIRVSSAVTAKEQWVVGLEVMIARNNKFEGLCHVNHKPFHNLCQRPVSSVRPFPTGSVINPLRLCESMSFVQEKEDVRMGEAPVLMFNYKN